MYVASISDKASEEIIKEKTEISQEAIDLKVDESIANQLLNEDRKTLTELGRSSLKVVLAGAVFEASGGDLTAGEGCRQFSEKWIF